MELMKKGRRMVRRDYEARGGFSDLGLACAGRGFWLQRGGLRLQLWARAALRVLFHYCCDSYYSVLQDSGTCLLCSAWRWIALTGIERHDSCKC